MKTAMPHQGNRKFYQDIQGGAVLQMPLTAQKQTGKRSTRNLKTCCHQKNIHLQGQAH